MNKVYLVSICFVLTTSGMEKPVSKSDHSFIVHTNDEKTYYLNAAWVRLMGYSADSVLECTLQVSSADFLKQTVAALCHPDEMEFFKADSQYLKRFNFTKDIEIELISHFIERLKGPLASVGIDISTYQGLTLSQMLHNATNLHDFECSRQVSAPSQLVPQFSLCDLLSNPRIIEHKLGFTYDPEIFLSFIKSFSEVVKHETSQVTHNLTSMRCFSGHKTVITTMCKDRAGKHLATADADGTIILWDLDTGEKMWVNKEAHTGAIFPMIFDGAGEKIASASTDGVKVWSVTDKKLLAMYNTFVTALCYDENRGFIAGLLNGKICHLSTLNTIGDIDCYIASIATSSAGDYFIGDSKFKVIKQVKANGERVTKYDIERYPWYLHCATDASIYVFDATGADRISREGRSFLTCAVPPYCPWIIAFGKKEPKLLAVNEANDVVLYSCSLAELKNVSYSAAANE